MYCAICGTEETLTASLWWDCDDGWRVSLLCGDCRPAALRDRPHVDHYAVAVYAEDHGCTCEAAVGRLMAGRVPENETEMIDTLYG